MEPSARRSTVVSRRYLGFNKRGLTPLTILECNLRLRTLLLCLLALLLAFAGMASLVVRAQIESNANNENNASNDKASPGGAAFVIYMNAQGEATCRVATPSERNQIMQRRGESHVIYAGAPRRDATSGKDFSPNAPPNE